jgi:hypothetical protein
MNYGIDNKTNISKRNVIMIGPDKKKYLDLLRV